MNFMQDYFSDQMQAPTPDPNIIDSIATNWLSPSNSDAINASQLAITQPVNPATPTAAQQPDFLNTIWKGFTDVGAGVFKGAGDTAKGVAVKLPETLAGVLANKMGLSMKPVTSENGKTTYYLTSPTAGVPAQSAKPAIVAGSGGGAGNIATSTIVFAIAGAALIYLIAKSR